MATRKKAKGKAKAKRRKVVAGKPATGKKAAKVGKRPPKKEPGRRASPVKAKPAAKPAPARTPGPPATAKPTRAGPVQPAAAWKPTPTSPSAQPAVAAKPTPASRPPAQPTAAKPTPPASPPAEPGERVGVVTHYYNHLGVAVVRVESGTLRVGDTICIRGHTTDFTQRVASLQVEHAPVTEAGPSDDCAVKVIAHAREHDVVYKVRP